MPLSKRLWSGFLLLAVASGVSAAPPQKGSAEKRKKVPEFVDVTRKVEVQFVEGLRSPDDQTHEVFVVLKNTSGANLPGPLALVFDEAKESAFSFDWYTEALSDGQEYYGLVDVDDSVPAKQSSRRRKVYLKTDAPVEIADRGRPEIPFRVIQLGAEHLAAKAPVDEEVAGKKYSREEFDRVKAIQERAAQHLLSTNEGVAGVFLGEDANGNLRIQVYAKRRGAAREVPGSFEGVAIETEVSGEFTPGSKTPPKTPPAAGALTPQPDRPAAAGPQKSLAPLVGNLTGFIDRPVCIGASGINSLIPGCVAGTIGCRVKDSAGNLYALSNNHVFAREVGREIDGTVIPATVIVGEPFQQPSPGHIFPTCPHVGFQLGTLADWEPFRFAAGPTTGEIATAPVNVMDAAIAAVAAADMGFAPPTDSYGALSRNPIRASIGLGIQKVGARTGWTESRVAAINGVISLEYTGGTARIERCIITRMHPSSLFGDQGDSGSLVVTTGDNRPVGLYFADGPVDSIICPIGPILDRFNVMVDDGQGVFQGLHSGRLGTAIGPVNRGIRR